MEQTRGLHHITAIAGAAQENLDFYAGVLGMRLVKKSVNQDDPNTYHLFYADAEGHPGTDLTFFPWANFAPPRAGYGLSTEVSLTVPRGSLAFWHSRFELYGTKMFPEDERFGRRVLPLTDPHGLRVALVENSDSLVHTFAPWPESPIPVEHQIRGLESARLVERDVVETASFLSDVLGFKRIGVENNWERFALGEGRSGQYLDVQGAPAATRGAWGVGCIHHLAWRVDDDKHELALRGRVGAAGARPTPVIDRFWFKSVYFQEPGGVLFELATDGPGFAVDEKREKLGETLVLPPWLERDRASIESVLPKLILPAKQWPS